MRSSAILVVDIPWAVFVVDDETKALALKISADEKADLYLYNGPVNEEGYRKILEAYSYQHEAAILLLTTNGGSANSAYRIAGSNTLTSSSQS